MKTLVNDYVNELCIIEEDLSFYVHYGLQVTRHGTLKEALDNFGNCLVHAMGCHGYQEGESGL